MIRTISDESHLVAATDDPPPSAEEQQQHSDENDENNGLEDSSSLQKELPLKMVSAVAEVLPYKSTAADFGNNEFVSSCGQQEQDDNDRGAKIDLHAQVSRYGSRVSELEAILSAKEAEFEANLLREVNPLKEQLKVYAQTTGLLVGEKAELGAALEECRAIAQRKTLEVEELAGKLKICQIRASELERELAHAKSSVEDTRKMYQTLHLDYAELDKKYNELGEMREDDQLEISELRQEVSMKNSDISSLERELEEKRTLLSLSELKIRQLSGTPPARETRTLEGDEDDESQHCAVVRLQEQLSQLRETLRCVNEEKEQAAKRYENYVRQLDERYEKMAKEHEASRSKLRALEDREPTYIERLADLDRSLQRERQKVEKLLPLDALEARAEQIDHLTKSLDALTLENANLESRLNERDSLVEALRRELEESREITEDRVEKCKLVTALESEQLGASRAVSQNQQLKAQLNEMHDAFVTLSNSKLDLTEQLQAERSIGRKLNNRLNNVESKLYLLEEQLRLKNSALEQMESEKLQTAQIADQMHHYQAQSQQARTLQQELQNSLGCIEILRRENQQLSAQLNKLREEAAGLSNGNVHNADGNCHAENSLYVPDPLKKLEGRFKETMERVAELTDDKQRLEHLVLQLQGETETIGEYISLYQKQRAILEERTKQREQTFRQVVEQRNNQQEQLDNLKVLVAKLVKLVSTKHLPATLAPNNSAVIEFDNESEHSSSPPPESDGDDDADADNDNDNDDDPTSEIMKILKQINEFQSLNDTCQDSCMSEPNFHPCPWCSGKLETV